MDDDIMAPDARQLISFDNFNNQPTRNDSGTTSTGSAIMGRYIGKVMLGSFPKMLIIFFCVVIAAYTIEITFQSTDGAYAASLVCYRNPKADKSGFRICLSLMGVAISSILVCMVLMIFDVFIPCVNTKFRRLAHAFSLMLSFIMGIALLVTSSLMTNIYIKYCESDLNYYEKCGDDEAHFLVLPVFGFFTMAAWGLNGSISIVKLRIDVMNNDRQ